MSCVLGVLRYVNIGHFICNKKQGNCTYTLSFKNKIKYKRQKLYNFFVLRVTEFQILISNSLYNDIYCTKSFISKKLICGFLQSFIVS